MAPFLSRGVLIFGISLLSLRIPAGAWAAQLGAARQAGRPTPIATLIEKLKDGNYAIRYKAASELEKLGRAAEPAIPALIDALGDDGAFEGSNSDFVCLKAIRTLLVLGPSVVPALAAAVKSHARVEVRRAAAGVLGLMGIEAQAAIPVLQAFLRDESIGVAAAAALWHIDPQGKWTCPTIAPKRTSVVTALIAGLHSQDREQRHDAVRALGEIGSPARQAIPALIERLTDEDYMVAGGAAIALNHVGPEARAALPALRKALHDADGYVRQLSLFALSRLAPREQETALLFVQMLKDPDPLLRPQAARALGQMGTTAEAAVPALIEALQDPGANAAAATALGKIGPPARAAVPALIRAMHDPDTKYYSLLRREATAAVGCIGSDARAAIPALIGAFEDRWQEVPPLAIESLVRLGPVAVPALAKALREGRPIVRVRSAETLGRIGPSAKAALSALGEALKDANGSVRAEAALALWRIDARTEAALPVLLEVLKASDRGAAGRAGEALHTMGPAARKAVPALAAMLEDKTHLAPWSVARALSGIGPPAKAAAPALAKALPRRRLAVGLIEAAWALNEMGAEAAPAVPLLIAALGDEDDVARWAAAGVLGCIGPPARAAVPALTKALHDPQPAVRASAAFALGQLGLAAGPAVPALTTLFHDPEPLVCYASLAALRTLGPAAKDAVLALGRLIQDRRPCIWRVPSKPPYFWRTNPDNLWNAGTGGDKSVPVLVAYHKERPVPVAELAIGVLVEIGPAAREAVPALRAACRDERISVRQAAAAALGKIDAEALARMAPSPTELETLWSALGGTEAPQVHQALWTLILAPRQTASWLRQRLQPVAPVEPSRIARLIDELDDAAFAVREKAARELNALGELAGPALKEALTRKPSLEVRRRIEGLLQRLEDRALTPEQLRMLRAITALERIGTEDARAVLGSLSKGAPGAGPTEEAKAALRRLSERAAVTP